MASTNKFKFGFGFDSQPSNRSLWDYILPIGGALAAAVPGIGLPLLIGGALNRAVQGNRRQQEDMAARQGVLDDLTARQGPRNLEIPQFSGMTPTGQTQNMSVPRPGGMTRDQIELLRVMGPQAQAGALSDRFFPEPETYGQPFAGTDENGNPVFIRAGNRGGVEQLPGVRPPQQEQPVEMVNVFDMKLNRPVGAINKRALERLSATEPGRYILGDKNPVADTAKTPVQVYQENFGPLVPGMMPEVVDGQVTSRQVPQIGGPKDQAVIEQERQKKLQAEAPGAKAALDTTTQFYDNVINLIDRIEKNPNTDDVVGSFEGSGSPWFTLLSGDNVSALSDIETLQDMLQVQGLQVMRDASKTGGAVGSVTEREWPKLSSRFGNLNRRQKEANFRDQLKRIKDEFSASKRRIQDVYMKEYGGGAIPDITVNGVPNQAMQGPALGQIEDGYRFLGGNAADPKNWERVF